VIGRVLSVVRRVVNGAAGVVLGALGGVAVWKAGALGFQRHVDALGFHHTALLGWIEVIVALLLLLTALSRGSGGETAFLGLLVLGFGVVVLVTGRALHEAMGVHAESGVLYVVMGGLTSLLGLATLGEQLPEPVPLPGRRVS
jgi:hypothetical protein